MVATIVGADGAGESYRMMSQSYGFLDSVVMLILFNLRPDENNNGFTETSLSEGRCNILLLQLDTRFFDLVFMVDIAIVVEDSTTWIYSGCGGVGDSSSSLLEILIVGIEPLLLFSTNIHMFLISNANGCRQEHKLARDHNQHENRLSFASSPRVHICVSIILHNVTMEIRGEHGPRTGPDQIGLAKTELVQTARQRSGPKWSGKEECLAEGGEIFLLKDYPLQIMDAKVLVHKEGERVSGGEPSDG
nr:hypothetical protein [Tanacetum cinerariifolium]